MAETGVIRSQEDYYRLVENRETIGTYWDSSLVYGEWARNNGNCLRQSEVDVQFVKILQLCMSVVSSCQVLFMVSRAPLVPWEAIYLPMTESITYGLAFTGNGYIRLATGKILPWARMASWLCTCPIMLGMVSNMALVKYKSQPLNPLMVASSIIRVVFGISATMSDDSQPAKWVFFFIAVIFFLFELTCVYAIFGMTIADFAQIQSPLGDAVVYRLNILRGIFFASWTCFPILWLVSSTSACLLDENISAVLYLMADALCKNSYGIVLWSTTWGLLNGKWDREYPRNRDIDGLMMDIDPAKEKQLEEMPNQNFDIKIMGQTIASVKRSCRRPRADMESQDAVNSREVRESSRKPRRGKSRGGARRKNDYSDDSDETYDSRRRKEDSAESYSDDSRDDRRRRGKKDRHQTRRGDDEYEDRDRRRDRRLGGNSGGFQKRHDDQSLEEKVLNSDDIAGLGSDPNIAQIMAAMKRNAEESLRLEALEKEADKTKKNDSMC